MAIKIVINAEQDESSVRGNAVVSGCDKTDKRIENGILRRLDNGNVWAWASVEVYAELAYQDGYNTVTIQGDSEYLGACSYKSEADFVKNSGYFDDMKATAMGNLEAKLELLKEYFDENKA